MTLSRHVITGLRTATIGHAYPRPVGRNAFRGHHGSGGTQTVLVVETDRGATGWGIPLDRPGDPAALLGRNLAELLDPAVGVTDPAAEFLDHPLHDLAARVLDVPLHVLLGSAGPDRVRCYSGALYFDDLDPDDRPAGLAALRDELAQDHAAGFRDFKLKVGRGHRWMPPREGLARDVEVTRLARELHPDAEILVDANDGFSPNTAMEYLAAVDDCRLYWLEEPFAEREEDVRELRRRMSAELTRPPRIADGEFQPDEQHLLRLARAGLLDVALMDVVGFGLTAWRRVMPLLAALGVRASPHAWGQPLKTAYAAQIAVGLGGVDLVEGVPGRTTGTDGQGYVLDDGLLTLPDRPGIGMDLVAGATA